MAKEKDYDGTYEFKISGIRTDVNDNSGDDLILAKRNLSYLEYGILSTVIVEAANRAFLKMAELSGNSDGEAVAAVTAQIND